MNVIYLDRSVIKRPTNNEQVSITRGQTNGQTSTMSEETDITGGQTDTTSGRRVLLVTK